MRNICPLISIATKKPEECLKSDCAFAVNSGTLSKGCAIVELAKNSKNLEYLTNLANSNNK